jgi:TolB-like protein/DNA-binding winged helix-turn-helix (wHTH) protein
MPTAVQFSDFVLDPRRFELRRGKRVLKLERIPMELLILLVERQGELVSRDEIVEKLWGKNVYLDTANSINTAIAKLRIALRDDAERPRYIQTVVGKGYRFVAAISQVQPVDTSVGREAQTAVPDEIEPATVERAPLLLHRKHLVVTIAALLLVVITAGSYIFRPRALRLPQTLAVLPFKPLNSDASDEYLELGMADALITKLSRLRGLIVRPTSAIRKYTGAFGDPLAAGQALQVDAVLEGNIQHNGDRLRVSLRLIRVADGSSLWSDSYDARFDDVFQVQDNVSERVADALAMQLSKPEKASLRKLDTANPQAYEMYMRGIYFWNKRNEDGLRKAVSYFEQAIALDGNYALAHAGLASALAPIGYLGYAPSDEIRPRMRAAATRAVTLDPSLPEAHVALAAVLTFYEWNWSQGEKEFQRALALNPNLPWARHLYALHLECWGRYRDALTHRQRAEELDPITPIILNGLGQGLFLLGDNDRALVQFRKALELDNSLDQARVGVGQIYEDRGDYEHAISEYRLAVQNAPGSRLAKAALGYGLARTGNTKEGRQILKDLIHDSQTEYVSPFQLAIICAGLGDNDAALDWLEKGYDNGDSALSAVLRERRFQSLHSYPRFKRLVERLGLPPAS